jgi:hypothetical protein
MADPTTMSLDSERGARLSQAAAKIQKDRQRIRRNTPAVSFSAEVFTPGLVYKDGHECADNLRVAYWKDEAKMMPATVKFSVARAALIEECKMKAALKPLPKFHPLAQKRLHQRHKCNAGLTSPSLNGFSMGFSSLRPGALTSPILKKVVPQRRAWTAPPQQRAKSSSSSLVSISTKDDERRKKRLIEVEQRERRASAQKKAMAAFRTVRATTPWRVEDFRR